MRIKSFILAFLLAMPLCAANQFVIFSEQAEALSLKGATIGFSAQEPKAVQLAAANLQQDFQRVMGFAPAQSEKPMILIGTVGFNKQIDQWVKSGKLADLKGKREKFMSSSVYSACQPSRAFALSAFA